MIRRLFWDVLKEAAIVTKQKDVCNGLRNDEKKSPAVIHIQKDRKTHTYINSFQLRLFGPVCPYRLLYVNCAMCFLMCYFVVVSPL